MINKPSRQVVRDRKHIRVRKNVKGTKERPRLNVFRSLNNMYAQIIDDNKGHTLVAASSLDVEIKEKLKFCGNKKAAYEVGKLIASRAHTQGIKQVVFDRGGYLYHGRVRELADAAREAGLEF